MIKAKYTKGRVTSAEAEGNSAGVRESFQGRGQTALIDGELTA